MKNIGMKRIIMFAVLSVVIWVILISMVRHYRQYQYNWDAKVNEYITQFNCELQYVESYQKDTVKVYKYQTQDNKQIEFEIKCYWGKVFTPFGFYLPITKAYITDEFREQICEYISHCDGVYDIEGKSIEEISSYVFNTMASCENLMSQYGVEVLTPHISFTFIDSDKEYKLEWANYNEIVLRDKLTEVLDE